MVPATHRRACSGTPGPVVLTVPRTAEGLLNLATLEQVRVPPALAAGWKGTWGALPPGSGDDSRGVHTRRARPREHERRLSSASLREGPSPYHQAQFSPQTGDLSQKGRQVP